MMHRFPLSPADIDPSRPEFAAATVGSTVRPGRGRTRAPGGADDKLKKPADGVPKKTPPARKAPARGRYVDEYARPAR